VNELPVKGKKTKTRKRWFYYFVLEYQNKIAIRRRMEKDIWQGLYEFPLIETANESHTKTILQKAEKKKWILKKGVELISVSPLFKQQLSHQLITGRFIKLSLKKKPTPDNDWSWVIQNKFGKHAFPQFINQFLRIKTG